MTSKSSQPLTDAELAQYEADRDLAADLLQSVREMNAEKLHVVLSPVFEVGETASLSQAELQPLLRASIAAGSASGAGAEAEQVFDRLEKKYQ